MGELSLEEQTGRALLAALGGQEWSIEHGSVDEISSRLTGDGEFEQDADRGRRAALALAHGRSLQARMHAAKEADRALITLAGGGTLTRSNAEETLFQKEEKRAFSPLRRSIEAALSEFDIDQSSDFDRALADVGVDEEILLVSPVAGATTALKEFLDATSGVQEGAVGALAADGKAALSDRDAWLRALDLPLVDGAFSEQRIERAGAILRESARRVQHRAFTRVVAPRDFAGHVVTSAPGPIRLFFSPALRARRFASLLLGTGAAVGASVMGAETATGDAGGRLFGTACALGLLSPVGMRAAFDDSRSDAERNARVVRCVLLLWARAHATAALVLSTRATGPLQEDVIDETRQAIGDTFGVDLGRAMATGLLAPPLPGGFQGRGRLGQMGGAVFGLTGAVALSQALRDRYDEAFPLVPAPYETVADGRAAITAGAVDLATMWDVGTWDGRVLADWVAELL